MACDLDWIILRPSVVVGRPACGGSALFHGLAALPVLPVTPNTGLLQVVQLDDVADTVLFFLSPGTPARLTLELAGPEQLPFTEVVRKYRRWLGWSEPRIVHLPAWVAGAPYRLGASILTQHVMTGRAGLSITERVNDFETAGV